MQITNNFNTRNMEELLNKLHEFSENNPNIPILDCIRNMRSLEIITINESSDLHYFFDEDKILKAHLKNNLQTSDKPSNCILADVSNCKTETKLSKLEYELGKLQKVHGEIIKRFNVNKSCDSFKFKDGAVYRVKLERTFGKATLD